MISERAVKKRGEPRRDEAKAKQRQSVLCLNHHDKGGKPLSKAQAAERQVPSSKTSEQQARVFLVAKPETQAAGSEAGIWICRHPR